MGGWTAVSSIPKQKSMHKRFLCATVSNNGDRRGVRLFLFILIAINLSIRAESFSSVVDYFSSGRGRGRGRGQDDWSCSGADADGASAPTDSVCSVLYSGVCPPLYTTRKYRNALPPTVNALLIRVLWELSCPCGTLAGF